MEAISLRRYLLVVCSYSRLHSLLFLLFAIFFQLCNVSCAVTPPWAFSSSYHSDSRVRCTVHVEVLISWCVHWDSACIGMDLNMVFLHGRGLINIIEWGTSGTCEDVASWYRFFDCYRNHLERSVYCSSVLPEAWAIMTHEASLLLSQFSIHILFA